MCYVIGSVPSSLCTSVLHTLNVLPGNSGITCAALCISSIASTNVPSTVCIPSQDRGLCGFIAATNVNSLTVYTSWSCITLGLLSTNPCSWSQGIGCNGNTVVSINLVSVGLTGNA